MEQPRPEVTVRDPRSPARPLSHPEPAQVEPATARSVPRRWAIVGGAAVLVGAGALVAVDVERDRRAAAEERRRDAVVDIALADQIGSSSTSYHPVKGTGTVQAAVLLVNSGPRAVEVTAAEIAGARFDGALPLAARGGLGALLLTRTVRCPRDGSRPPAEPDATALVLRVRTAAGPRSAVLDVGRLPVGYVHEQVQRACGFSPP